MIIIDETMRLIGHAHYYRVAEESRRLCELMLDGFELILVPPIRTGKTRDLGEHLLRQRCYRTPKRRG